MAITIVVMVAFMTQDYNTNSGFKMMNIIWLQVCVYEMVAYDYKPNHGCICHIFNFPLFDSTQKEVTRDQAVYLGRENVNSGGF